MSSCGKFRFWIALVPLLAAGTLCWSQERLLQLNYREGETYPYKIHLEIEIQGDAVPGGKTTIQEERVQIRTVRKVYPDGAADVLFTNTSYELRQNKEVISSTATDGLSVIGFPVDVPVLIRISKAGGFLDIRPVKELRPSQKARAEAFFQNLKGLSMGFPEMPVKVGQTWDRQVLTASDAPGLGTIDIAMNVTYTFAGIQAYYGVECARITGRGSGTGVFEGGGGTMEVTTSSETLLDLEGGREMKNVESGAYAITLVTEEGERKLKQTLKQSTVMAK